MKLTLYLMAGSGLIIPGILLLYSSSGLQTFDMIRLHAAHFSHWTQKIAFVMLFFGFGVLAAVWPSTPVAGRPRGRPTAVSMLHAGVLMKLGSFAILRVAMYLCPAGFQYWAQLMALLATVGIVYGVFVGLAQTDLKYVIGYSSVSHMGIVCLGLATGSVDGLNGSVFQMFAHGIMTALFFSSVGFIYDRTHTRDIHQLGGFSRIMPVASAFFITAALCGAGVPGMASFGPNCWSLSPPSRSTRCRGCWPSPPWWWAPFSPCEWCRIPFSTSRTPSLSIFRTSAPSWVCLA